MEYRHLTDAELLAACVVDATTPLEKELYARFEAAQDEIHDLEARITELEVHRES